MHITEHQTEHQTARVTVITEYEGPERWFTAVCSGKSREIATYACAPAETVDPDDPYDPDDRPHPDAVREIEKMHPGCFFVYLD